MGCCCEQKVSISFSGPLKIQMVDDEDVGKILTTLTYDNNFTVTAEGEHLMYTLPVDKAVKVKVKYVDRHGNEAQVDGEVDWESSDEEIATVRVNEADTTTAIVAPMGKTGQVQVKSTADADLGEGVRELITIADIEIVAGEAVAGVIEPVGEPMGPEPKK